MSKINVLICGATGYIGVQLTKILANHKKVNIKYLCGSSSIGKKITSYEKSLNKYKKHIGVMTHETFNHHIRTHLKRPNPTSSRRLRQGNTP